MGCLLNGWEFFRPNKWPVEVIETEQESCKTIEPEMRSGAGTHGLLQGGLRLRGV